MKYAIIEGYSDMGIKNLVEEYLDKGWELQGGICITVYQNTVRYAQAMVHKG